MRWIALCLIVCLDLSLTGSRCLDRAEGPPAVCPRAEELYAELKLAAGRFGSVERAQACEDYRRIHDQARQIGDEVLLGRTLVGLATCHFMDGRYDIALQHNREAAAIFEANGEPAALCAAEGNLGTLYQELGDLEAAEAALSKALRLARGAAPQYLPHALIALAMVKGGLGRTEPAGEHLRQGVEVAEAAGHSHLSATAYDWLGMMFLRRKQYQEAEKCMLESYRLRFAGDRFKQVVTLQNLGMLRLEQGDFRSAKALLESAEASREPAARGYLQWPFYLARAQVRRRSGRRGEALVDLRAAVDLIRNRRAAVPAGDSLRIGFEGRVNQAYEALAESAADERLGGGPAHLVTESFEALEENRASSLLARAGERPWWQRNLRPEYWRRAQQLRQLERRALRDGSGKAREQMLEARKALLEEEARAGLAHPWNAEGLLRRTTHSLGSDAVFFSFHLAKQASYRWTVTREGASVTRLKAGADLAAAVAEFAHAVRRDQDARPVGRGLYQMMFRQLPARVSRLKRWIVSLDDALFEAPLAALPDQSGRFLAEAHALETTPGAGVFAREGRPESAGDAFVGVADPIYNRADGRGRAARFRWPWNRATEAGVLPARLVASRREVTESSSAWPGPKRILHGETARIEAVRQALKTRPAVVHFATHVEPDAWRGDGAVALSLTESGEPELLDVSEIGRWEVPGALIVLSGCSSGTGAVLPGTGLVGLTRAWLMAGASAVVASRWATADEPGALFVSFYRHLRGGAPAAEALRRAQVEMLQSGGWRAKPSYWAAYFVAGSGVVGGVRP